MLVIAVGLAALAGGCGTSASPHAAPSSSSAPIPPAHLSAAQLARLPSANTFGRLQAEPRDLGPSVPGPGVVLHPTAARVVYASPGGPPVAVLPSTQLGSPTWVPVVRSRPGWDLVLLPTRPNGSAGWVYLGDGGLQAASDAYRIEVNLAGYRLTVTDGGRTLGSWAVAVGAPLTPTPTGRTFLLASAAPAHPTFSPLILPLGLHSDALESFDGGPGTVALHGWPDPTVFGHPVSHGCVRVPAAALRVLVRIPIGSLVTIVSRPGAAPQAGSRGSADQPLVALRHGDRAAQAPAAGLFRILGLPRPAVLLGQAQVAASPSAGHEPAAPGQSRYPGGSGRDGR
jgi:L,D-transpeptidase catalytic domain